MSETVSIIVWCWHDLQTDALLLRAVYANTAEEVPLRKGSFLLRISLDENTSTQRCHIRHIASGREAYIQGGPNLRAFVKDCLLSSSKSEESEGSAPPAPPA
jgi:hypothetical protein